VSRAGKFGSGDAVTPTLLARFPSVLCHGTWERFAPGADSLVELIALAVPGSWCPLLVPAGAGAG